MILNPSWRKPTHRFISLCSLVALMGGSGLAAAQILSDDTHIAYTIKPGDMMSVLAQQFLQDPAALQTVARINRIANVHRVPVGKVIKIPRDLLKYVPATAQVTHLRCRDVLRLDGPGAQEIRLGSTLTEGAVLRIPPGCQFTMTLEDNTSVRLLSGAVVQLTTLRRNAFDPSPEVKIDLLDGRAHVNVPTKRPPGDAPFRVLTPTAVAGIRGTQFRVGFVPEVRSSQLELVSGAVAARGPSESQERLAGADQGVATPANGMALPVEPLLPAPRFARVAEQADGRALLVFRAPDPAQQFHLSTADEANFNTVRTEGLVGQAQVLVPDFNAQARFFQWASITDSGLFGHTADFAICKGYAAGKVLRCNVPFSFEGFNQPHFQLQKIEAGAALTVMEGPVTRSEDNLLVFKGLPSGQYRWRIEYEFLPGKKSRLEGQFELIAVPGPHA